MPPACCTGPARVTWIPAFARTSFTLPSRVCVTPPMITLTGVVVYDDSDGWWMPSPSIVTG